MYGSVYVHEPFLLIVMLLASFKAFCSSHSSNLSLYSSYYSLPSLNSILSFLSHVANVCLEVSLWAQGGSSPTIEMHTSGRKNKNHIRPCGPFSSETLERPDIQRITRAQ